MFSSALKIQNGVIIIIIMINKHKVVCEYFGVFMAFALIDVVITAGVLLLVHYSHSHSPIGYGVRVPGHTNEVRDLINYGARKRIIITQ